MNQLDVESDFFFRASVPKTANPQSPQEAQSIVQHSGLLSPFSRGHAPAPQLAVPPPAPLFAQPPSGGADSTRHRVSALGPLPAPLSSALRQLELQPQAERCTVGCGTGGVAWAALGSTLYVWRAAAPQGCRRLASPLPSEVAVADLVCEVQPGAGEADEVLLLACWSSRASCRLTLYRLQHLSQPPPLASPPPVAELAVPLPPSASPRFLRATPGTIAPAPAPAAAILAASGSQLFAVGVEPLGAAAPGAPLGALSYALRLTPLARSGGSLSAIYSAVSSYFTSTPRAAPSAKLSAVSIAADWMVTLSAASAPDAGSAAAGADDGSGASEVVECWKRAGAGQSYTHAGSFPLRPLLQQQLASSGAHSSVHVADLVALPGEAAAGKLLVLLATRSPGSASCSLTVAELTIAPSGALRAGPAAASSAFSTAACVTLLPNTTTPGEEAAQLASLSLVAAQRTLGPAIALRPSAAHGRALMAPGSLGGGEAWALRDVGGERASELVGVAGSASGGGLLGPIPDAKLLGAAGDELGVLLLYSHQIVRLAAVPARPAAATSRASVQRLPAGGGSAVGGGTDAAFVRRLTDAFAQYEAAQRDGWHGATELGRAIEEEALATAGQGTAVRAVLELSSNLVSAAAATQSAAQLTLKLHQHKLLISFVRLHALLDPAAHPTQAAALVTHGEKLAAGLELRKVQNAASPAHSALLIALFEAVVKRVPDAAAAPASSGGGAELADAQESFFGALLMPGRWEALLSTIATAAATAVAEEHQLARVAFLCQAAALPLAAARAHRTEASLALSSGIAGGIAAAESAATASGVRHWTCAADLSDAPLAALSDAACSALKAAVPTSSSDGSAPPVQPPLAAADAERVGGLVDILASMHEERLLGMLSHLRAVAMAAESPEAFAPTAPLKPPPLAAFEKGCEQAAAALVGVGATPHAASLAETFHDYKTLGLMCTRRSASLPASLLRGRHVPTPADLRHELIARLIAAPPPPPLYPHEQIAHPDGFVHELCLAHYESGMPGCRELLRLPESYPFLAPHLTTFLASYPRLLWLHLVDEACQAEHSDAASSSFDAAARALYGWGMQTGQGVTPVERKTFLSLGKLCHRAAVLPDSSAPIAMPFGAPHTASGSAAAAAAAAAARGVPPPLPPPPPPLESLPRVRGVPVSIEGERREVLMDVALLNVASEHYVLRVQEELNLGAEAKPTEQILSALLAHASGGDSLSGATLHGQPLSRDAALHLALEIAHKTSWRYSTSERGSEAKRSSFLRILRTALVCELDKWRDLANELTRLNDSQLIAALAGEAGGHPEPGTRPLALFSLFSYQAAKAAAAAAGPSKDDVWLGSGEVDTEGSMLSELKASLGLPEADARRVGALLQRAQSIAAMHAAPPPPEAPSAQQQQQQQPVAAALTAAAPPRAEEEWVDVGSGDAMQQD